MEVRVLPKQAGESLSQEGHAALSSAWRRLPELQNRREWEYLKQSAELIEAYNRLEILAFDKGDLVGAGVLIELVDIHYGTVACLMHCIGLDGGGGGAVLASAMRHAKACGYKWFSRSSRVSATEYRQLYRRL